MAVDRGALNAGLMAQIAEARQRVAEAEARRDEKARLRADYESRANAFKTEADSLAGEADGFDKQAASSKEEAGKREAGYNTQYSNLGYYKSRTADLKNLYANLDTTTAGKISALQTSDQPYGSATPTTGGSDYAPPSSFNQEQSTFGELRDKVRAGFEGRATMDRPDAGQVLDRNRFFNRRTA